MTSKIGIVLCLSLIGCGRDRVDAIVAQLRDPNPDVRRSATHSLVEHPLSDPRIIDELTKNVADKSADVRYGSVEALGKIGPAASAGLPFLRIRMQDVDKNIRLRSAFAIQRIDPADRTFVPVLTAVLQEGDGRTLLEVGKLGPGAVWAVPTLSTLLSHESPKVRMLAAKALGNIGPAAQEAEAALEAARRDSNVIVQRAATDALAHVEKRTASSK
jgi:HEAT repeat protein